MGDSPILDLRSEAIVYLNDIEKDERYRRLAPSLNDILRPTVPNQLRMVRKNLFTLVAAVNPVSAGGARVVGDMLDLLERGLPVRLALLFVTRAGQNQLRQAPAVFVSNNDAKVVLPSLPGDDAAVAIVRGFDAALAAADGDEQSALRWLDHLYESHLTAEMTNDELLTSLTARAVYESFIVQYSHNDWVRLSAGRQRLTNLASYFLSF